ncbi:MAG TPA: type IV pilin protein [Burkholderiales bacterium]|nr:type IV pilin protein [Burkholderiales bacterium]
MRARFSTRLHPGAGFTLIELMIAVLVVAILVVIAYPSYQEHLRKGRRAAAQTFLVEAASREQQYLLDRRAYAVGPDALSALSLTVPPEVAPFYSITVAPDAPTVPPTYTIRATPVPGSAQEADGALTLTHDGAKTRGGTAGW